MKVIDGNKPVFQGDVMFVRIDKLPDIELVPVEKNIVALSETSHHHVAERAQVFRGKVDDGMTLYMKALGPDGIDIVHHRSWDTHETLRLLGDEGSVFKIQRQREYTPEGWRRVED